MVTLDAILSPRMAALMAPARLQGMSSATAALMQLLNFLMAQSRCFRVVDRGAEFSALQLSRETAQGQQLIPGKVIADPTLITGDSALAVQVVY